MVWCECARPDIHSPRRREETKEKEGTEPSGADRRKESSEEASLDPASAERNLCAEAQWELAGADRNWREGPELSVLRIMAIFDNVFQ